MTIVTLPLPIQLINGNLADGGQVMTDLNAIASNVNAHAAMSGINSDITSLTALTSITSTLTINGWSISNSFISGGTITGTAIDSTTTAPTAALGTNTNELATTAFVQAAAFATVLPAQPGTPINYRLNSFNGVASWVLSALLGKRAITTTDTLGLADVGNLLQITSGTFTLSIDAGLLASDKTTGLIYNSGTGVVTFGPSDGLGTFAIYPREIRQWYIESGVCSTIVISPFYINATSTFTYIDPPGYNVTLLDMVGGAGQGGAGRRGAASSVRAGGAAGGTPARVIRQLYNRTPGTSTTVSVGAGGTSGGAAQTVNDSDGADGQAGGNTSFGTLAIAYGGAAGKGGAALAVSTSGSGSLAVGVSSNAGAATIGGSPSATGQRGSGANTFQNNWGEGGGGGTAATVNSIGGFSEYGGAASGCTDPTGTSSGAITGSSMFGVGAASAGAWINASNTMPTTASAAGANGTYSVGGGVTGGTSGATPTAGANGIDSTSDSQCGSSGAGGGATITAAQTGMAGGHGGFPGGAGGGGGASLNGLNSGAGGAGANGRAIITGAV